jgi:hypothetical protein
MLVVILVDTIFDIRYSFLDEKNRNGPSAGHLRSRSGPKTPSTAGRQPVHKHGSKISTEQRQASDLPGKQGLSGVKSKPGRTSRPGVQQTIDAEMHSIDLIWGGK